MCLSRGSCRDNSEGHRYLADKRAGVQDLKQEVSGWALAVCVKSTVMLLKRIKWIAHSRFFSFE